jgi:hypothetical protein
VAVIPGIRNKVVAGNDAVMVPVTFDPFTQ